MSSDPPPEVPKPAIVIVPGAFHTAAHFQPLTKALQRLSYDTTTITLPSIGAKAGTATLEDDIQTIRSTLERLAEDEREILLMLHAYGGVPGCQAVRGLEKSQRKEEEKKGGIAQILLMGGFVPESNQSLLEALGGGMPSWAKAEVSLL